MYTACYLMIPLILNARFQKGHNLFPLILHCRGETSNTLGKRLYLLIPTNLQLGSRKESKMTFKPVITHFIESGLKKVDHFKCKPLINSEFFDLGKLNLKKLERLLGLLQLMAMVTLRQLLQLLFIFVKSSTSVHCNRN